MIFVAILAIIAIGTSMDMKIDCEKTKVEKDK